MTTKSITLYTILTVLMLIGTQACKEEGKTIIPDIQIGKGESLKEVSLNRQTERKILLSGGNGKYKVNIQDSRIAGVSISKDTLRIKGIFEGETFATVTSHDKRAQLKISVVPPKIGFSHDHIEIHPKDHIFHVSLAGGGELVTLTKEDPEDVISYKWDGKTGIVEIKGIYEGEAYLTATGQDGQEAKLHVTVKVADKIIEPGVYGTDGRYFSSNEIIRFVMISEKEGVGVTLHNSARPYGGWITTYEGSSLEITPEVVNPTLGETLELDLQYKGKVASAMKSGKYLLKVEEIREDTGMVILRHPRFKVHIPYYKR